MSTPTHTGTVVTDLPPAGTLTPRRVPGRTPGPGRPGKVWGERLATARANPGEWVQLDGDYSESVAGALRAGRYSGTHKGELETRRRSIGGGRFVVFVRVLADAPAPIATADWGKVNEDGVPEAYVDRVEELSGGSVRYYGPMASPNGQYNGEGWHDSPEAYVAALVALRAKDSLPY